MNGLPSGVAVQRYVPEHLLEGFLSKIFRLDGGVLRRAEHPGKGQIVGFLTEGWDLARQLEQSGTLDVRMLEAAVGNAKMAANLAAGIGVLNLGVQVAGFAIVMKRLDRISAQIDKVHDELQKVGQDVSWLVSSQKAQLRADAEAAIATAERAARQNDRNLLNLAKMSGDRVRRHLVNLTSEMLLTGHAVPQRELFEEFIHMAALVAHAEARCDEAVEGAGQAAKDLVASAEGLRRLSDRFRDQVRNFNNNPLALLEIGDEGRRATKELADRISNLVGRLESYVPQLQLQDALGLDADGWRRLVAPEGGGPLTCISLEKGLQEDLLERVLLNTRQ